MRQTIRHAPELSRRLAMGIPLAIASLVGVLLPTMLLASDQAAQPLHARIDALIDASAKADGVATSPTADDAAFMRRVYLDLAGIIPTADQARTFLADKAPDKRTKLIDRLLAGEYYARHMAERFNVMLMERRNEHDGWMTFLHKAFEENRPWDVLASQIIDPDKEHDVNKHAAFFYTERLRKVGAQATDYPGLTRDVGRLFAGMDLQCAQCHRHLTIDDYDQVDFQGLFAVYLNIELTRGSKHPAINEKLMDKPIEYVSVFKKTPKTTPPIVPGTRAAITIPAYESDDEKWLVKPDRKKKVTGVPRFSPLDNLAKGLCNGENPAFRKNIANRLWAYMLGRGLVHPLDLHHSDNPPSHPALLALLASEMAKQKFDIKWMLRQIAMSKTYQRSSVLPHGVDPLKLPANRFTVAQQRHLTAEQLMWSTLRATGSLDRLMKDKDALEAMRQRFVKSLANPPKEPEEAYAPSLAGALFLLNDENVLTLLKPAEGNLMARLLKLEDVDAVADELYLSVFSRTPTQVERAELASLMKKHASDAQGRQRLLEQVAWALLASTEFAVNH